MSSPSWNDLPLLFKENVVENLDLTSRLSLRLCSKNEHNLVFLNLRSLYLSKTDKLENRYRSEFCPNPKSLRIDDLVHLTAHKKTKFRKIEIVSENDHFLEDFSKSFKKLRVEIFHWSPHDWSETSFLKIWNILDPKHLKELEIYSWESPGIVEILEKTEQWKSLEKYFSFEEGYSHLKSFENLEKVDLRMKNVNLQDLKDFLTNFRKKPLDSYFELQIEQKMENISEFLEDPVENKPLGYQHVDATPVDHTQWISSLINDKFILILEISYSDDQKCTMLCGRICRISHLKEDFLKKFPEHDINCPCLQL